LALKKERIKIYQKATKSAVTPIMTLVKNVKNAPLGLAQVGRKFFTWILCAGFFLFISLSNQFLCLLVANRQAVGLCKIIAKFRLREEGAK
jgi:hypothetical protein